VAEVRKVEPSEVATLAPMMARSFKDDPGISWAVPKPQRRRRHLPRYFELQLERVYLPKGEVYTTGDGAAAAVWAPPDRWETPLRTTMTLFPVMATACGSKLARSLKMVDLMEKRHRAHAEPHYYLAFIGTDPDRQGHGHGTALLEAVLRKCDTEGVGAYLEASSLRNQALYHRHRFEVVEELRWPGGGPPFWRMWRDPAPASP
jgi:ribosomal protein S18 acetylase RimI-like enzyme